MRRARKLSLLAAVVLLLPVLAVVGVAAALHTAGGGQWLSALLSRSLTGEDRAITVHGLRLSGLLDLAVERVELADRQGVWAVLSGAGLAWSPAALLSGELRIHALTLERVELRRAPIDGAAAKAPAPAVASPSPSPSGPPTLPRLPIAIRIDRIAATVSASPDLAGTALDLQAAGHLQAGPDQADTLVELRRSGATDPEARLRLGWAGGTLALDLSVARPVAQLVIGLGGAADSVPALALALNGSGPLADWHGALTGDLPDRRCLDGTLGVSAGQGGPRPEGALSFGLRFQPQCLPDAALAGRLAGAPVSLDGRLVFDGDRLARLDGLRLASAVASASLDGGLEPLDLRFAAAVPDLERFGASGPVQASGHVGGSLAAPEITADLASAEGGAAGLRWRQLESSLRIAAATGWTVSLHGGVAALAAAGKPAQPLRWSVLAQTDAAATLVRLAEARLEGFGGRVAVLGTIGRSGAVALRGSLRLPRLAELQPFAGLPLHGQAMAEVAVSGDARRSLAVAVIGRSAGLSFGNAEAEALLGPAPSFTIHAVHRNAATRLRARLSGDKARLALDGPLMPGLGLAWRLELPELPQASRLAAQGLVLGRLSAPLLWARLDGETARSGQPLRLEAALEAAGLERPSGTLRAALRGGRLEADLSTAFRLGDGVALDDITLRAPSTRLEGALAWRGGSPSGALKGQVGDLSPWSALAGQPLFGALGLDARLTGGARPTAELTLTGSGLGAGGTRIDRLSGRASIADPLGSPRGTVRLEASGGTVAGKPLRSLALRAEAAGSTVGLHLDAAAGEARQPLSLSSEGTLSLAGGTQTLRLSRLQAKAAGLETSLQAPAVLEHAGTTVTLAPLRLSLGGGRVELSGRLSDGGIDARLTLANLPLKLAEPFLPEEARLAGSLNATVKAGGRLDAPSVDLEVNGQGLGLAQGGAERLNAGVKALWQGQRLTVDASASGTHGTSLKMQARMPLPASLKVPDGAAIEAHLAATADLGQWAAALPLPEHKLAGTLAADLTVGGTVAAPLVSGRASLAKGSYEFYPTATQLRDLSATLTAQDSRSLAVSLSAVDTSRQGKLSGEGRVTLEGGVPGWDLALTLQDFRLLNLDATQATASAQLTVSGRGDHGRVEGKVAIGPLDYQVTTGPFARRPAKLAVVEVNGGPGTRKPPPPPSAPKAPLALDLAVEVELDRVFVRGQGLESDWRGALSIGGTTATPLVRGSLEAVRGTLDMVGQRFTLVDSSIGFDGGAKVDPILDITAEASANDITAQIKLAGTASRPELSFTSTPALPSDEVLSRLLFGKGAGELSVTQQLALAKAAASLAGGGGGGFDPVTAMRGGLGLDQLEVGADSDGKGLSPTVKAGKYIARDTFVRVEQGVGASQEKVTIEHRLGHGLSVEADVGRQGGGGVGMSWRKNY